MSVTLIIRRTSVKHKGFNLGGGGILDVSAMQQYDVDKKKRKLTLGLRYAVMTIAVAIISTICILLALGYRFDFTSNRVEQGALVQFDSFPNNATITLDGEVLSYKTAGKSEVATGTHDVVFSKDGYRNWTKHFTVKAGEVRWLTYARLVPTTVQTDSVKEFEGVASELPSPDRKSIALLTKSDSPVLTLVDIADPKKIATETITIPQDVLVAPAGVTHVYSLIEWNLNSKYLLVKHDAGSVHEYLRVNVTDAKDVVNLSTKFGVSFTDIHFSSESTFYGVENGNLRKFDLGSSSLSEPLAKDVVQMRLYGSSDIVYVRHTDAQYVVGVIVGGKAYKVSSYDDTTPLLVDITSYFSDRYVAITRGGSFELIKSPEKSASDGLAKVVTLSYPSDLKWLDISSNGRFVITGNGAQFMTYDIELKQRTDANFPSLLSDTTIAPQWLDGYMLVSTGDNKLRWSDFDGNNQQIITDALPALPVTLSTDNKLLYNFTKTQAGVVSLQASKLTTE